MNSSFTRRLSPLLFCMMMVSDVRAENFSWQKIQQETQYAVVQIINHSLEVDDLVPFRRGGVESRGSGFIIKDEERYFIVTNFHVVQNSIRLFVQLPLIFGNQRFEVAVVGIAPDNDLALLSFAQEDLEKISSKQGSVPCLELGDSSVIKRSDELLGIGFPLGQTSPKSATGVVSGFETIPVSLAKIYAVQVTKPCNPGNSGGPILNTEGQVVAIDVAGPNAPTDNIAYAIPINDFKIIQARLARGELVKKPYIGASSCAARDHELAELLHNPTPAGCYVTAIFKGGLFESWGIQEGDMIYEINDLALDAYGCVESPLQIDRKPLVEYILSFPLGTLFDLVVYRRGEKIKTTVALVFKEEPVIRWRPLDYEIDYEIVGGLILQNLSLNVMQAFSKAPGYIQARIGQYQIYEEKRNQPVVIVTQILAGSLAAESRSVGVGEFITHVNGIPVATLADVRNALLSGDSAFVTFKNDDGDLIALRKNSLYKHEPLLAKHFGYSITPGMAQLLKQKR